MAGYSRESYAIEGAITGHMYGRFGSSTNYQLSFQLRRLLIVPGSVHTPKSSRHEPPPITSKTNRLKKMNIYYVVTEYYQLVILPVIVS